MQRYTEHIDEIENLYRDGLSEFPVELDGESMWNDFEKTLPPQKKSIFKNIKFWLAISVGLNILLALLFVTKYTSEKTIASTQKSLPIKSDDSVSSTTVISSGTSNKALNNPNLKTNSSASVNNAISPNKNEGNNEKPLQLDVNQDGPYQQVPENRPVADTITDNKVVEEKTQEKKEEKSIRDFYKRDGNKNDLFIK